jgi:hypothetical protein
MLFAIEESTIREPGNGFCLRIFRIPEFLIINCNHHFVNDTRSPIYLVSVNGCNCVKIQLFKFLYKV